MARLHDRPGRRPTGNADARHKQRRAACKAGDNRGDVARRSQAADCRAVEGGQVVPASATGALCKCRRRVARAPHRQAAQSALRQPGTRSAKQPATVLDDRAKVAYSREKKYHNLGLARARGEPSGTGAATDSQSIRCRRGIDHNRPNIQSANGRRKQCLRNGRVL